VVEAGHGRAVRYRGNYEDYLHEKTVAEAAPAALAAKSAPSSSRRG